MNKILLHICCAPCATHCIDILEQQGYEVILFFSNSNIMPKEEYEKRLENARKLASIKELTLIEDTYDNDEWLKHIKGYEGEKEGGARCERCFRFNLSRAAKYAAENNIEKFTTSLTVSPHKNSELIFNVGDSVSKDYENLTFEHFNFKKQNGFLNSIKLSQEYGLYRQSYCGCIYSIRITNEKPLSEN